MDDAAEQQQQQPDKEEAAAPDDEPPPTQEEQDRRQRNIKALLDNSLDVQRQPLLSRYLSVREGELQLKRAFKTPLAGAASQSDALRRRLAARRHFVPWGSSKPFVHPVQAPLPGSQLADALGAPPAPAAEDLQLPPGIEPLVLWEPPPEAAAAAADAAAAAAAGGGGGAAAGGGGEQAVVVDPMLTRWLRPHQREGVQFMFECVCGLRLQGGQGCILADDMGLGKTLQGITLMWTLLQQGSLSLGGTPVAKRAIIVCPTSLVSNWAAECDKWLKGRCRTLPLCESSREDVIASIAEFVSPPRHRPAAHCLIISYETFRLHAARLAVEGACDLLICDEAHRLKNDATATNRALDSLPCRRRVLLSGTPLQNALGEFFAMVDFANPGCLGSHAEFRRHFEAPILAGREPGAPVEATQLGEERSSELSSLVNTFILRRTNKLLSEHLPPKVVSVVCCSLTPLQRALYEHFLHSNATRRLLSGSKATGVLSAITCLKKLCNSPKLIYDAVHSKAAADGTVAEGFEGVGELLPPGLFDGGRPGRGEMAAGWEELSGKMAFVARLLHVLRTTTDDKRVTAAAVDVPRWWPAGAPSGSTVQGPLLALHRLPNRSPPPPHPLQLTTTASASFAQHRVVIVSNYTQTLDLFAQLCRQRGYQYVRLDGSTSISKRQKLVQQLNAPGSQVFVFLLSSKAGGCGLNLVGASRLILFDPCWNPANDKQAAGRVWRDGQRKRVYVYRCLSSGTIEEKVFQRQLSKEGLQALVDSAAAAGGGDDGGGSSKNKAAAADKGPNVSLLSAEELRQLFSLRADVASDTYEVIKGGSERAAAAAAAAARQRQAAPPKKQQQRKQAQQQQQRRRQQLDSDSGVSLGTSSSGSESESESAGGTAAAPLCISDSEEDEVMRGVEGGSPARPEARAGPAAAGGGGGMVVAAAAAAVEAAAAADGSKPPDAAPAAEAAAAAAQGAPGKQQLAMRDGFRPQIGQPSEEDLANFAHHTAAALHTVPDEALRAAAADGPPVVTFVFSCSVPGRLDFCEPEPLKQQQQRAPLARSSTPAAAGGLAASSSAAAAAAAAASGLAGGLQQRHRHSVPAGLPLKRPLVASAAPAAAGASAAAAAPRFSVPAGAGAQPQQQQQQQQRAVLQDAASRLNRPAAVVQQQQIKQQPAAAKRQKITLKAAAAAAPGPAAARGKAPAAPAADDEESSEAWSSSDEDEDEDEAVALCGDSEGSAGESDEEEEDEAEGASDDGDGAAAAASQSESDDFV